MKSFLKKALVIGVISIAPSAFAVDMTGAGATFPYPIYAKWAEAFKAKTGSNLNYQSIGRKFCKCGNCENTNVGKESNEHDH